MAQFELAIPTVLANEGGLVDDPSDAGGLTKYGISQRSYPNLDIRNLTVEQASAIYLRDFWIFGGIVDQSVATKIFDSYVNMRHAAIRIVQQVVSVPQDGVYGSMTEKSINNMNPTNFLVAFRIGLVGHYSAIVAANPSQQKFLRGWLNRANQ